MGYRSNLMVLIYPEPGDDESAKFEQLKVLMATTFKDVSDEFGNSYMTWVDADHVLKFDIKDVKWYPSYSDVQMFEAMLSAFSEEEIEGYCTEFVRIGEESDDVENRYTGEACQHYLNVRREIGCNI